MRAIALIVALLAPLALPASAAAQDVVGFDHRAHDKAKPVECARCHPTTDDGTLRMFPDGQHRPCSDAGCHKPWPLQPNQAEFDKFCVRCHKKSDIKAGKVVAFYPPFSVAPDHAAPFPHARHLVQGGTGYLCTTCHSNHGEPPPPPPSAKEEKKKAKAKLLTIATHDSCKGCHASGTRPFMSECSGCHKPTDSIVARPPRPWDPYQVTYKFSHTTHSKKMTAEEGRRCPTCHESLATAKDGEPIPKPKMQTCGKCHDGKKSFSVVGTCSKCHALAAGEKPTPPPEPPAEPKRFSHGSHQKLGVDVGACASCHTLDARFLAETPTKGQSHMPCATSGCHLDEFFVRPEKSKKPPICSGCHLDSRPFAPARFGPLATKSEFGRDFSHLAHVKGLGEQGNGFCAKCHQGRFEVQPTAQSHGTCGPCHGTDAHPRMNECGGCHTLGAQKGTLATRDPNYPWYVRQKFEHADHDMDPRSGQQTTCLLCHDQVVQASSLSQIGRPRMQQCDACHDGKKSFKTTGFQCWRCHGSPEK